jgi:hypothetical protein
MERRMSIPSSVQNLYLFIFSYRLAVAARR